MREGVASLKAVISGALLDAPRYEMAIRFPYLAGKFSYSWIDLHNRHERVTQAADQRGVRCGWLWTSALFYCERRPDVGRRLLGRALAEWPIEFSERPLGAGGPPKVSFIIGHRGRERARHLLATLASLAGQRDTVIECVVVEQSTAPEIEEALPGWVRYVHISPPSHEMPYSRSWAFNVGAREARGRILVFHDNDICAPRSYAAEVVAVFERGFEAARLQRFVFYLTEGFSEEAMASRELSHLQAPEAVVQNCEGHTVAVDRDVYFEVGGHDEGFLGWGGEDNEFFDRLRSRRLHDHAYLPFLHLYHPAQEGKGARHGNTAYFESRMRIPREERISELRKRAPQ